MRLVLHSFWLRYVGRSFLRSGRRAWFAIICVVVGVAGVVALQTASITVQRALTSNVRAANGGDISLTTDDVPLSSTDLRVFRGLKQQGAITAWTAMATVHATAVGANGRLVPFDVDLVEVPPYPLGGELSFVKPSNGTVSGALARPQDVLVSAVLAGELGVAPGSRLAVNGIGGSGLHAIVRGVVAETTLTHSAAMTARLVDTPRLTHAALHYTAVFVNVSGNPQGVASYLSSRFPSDNVQTVVTFSVEQSSLATDAARLQQRLPGVLVVDVGDLTAIVDTVLNELLRLLAVLTALVLGAGVAVVANGVALAMLERRREIALFKAVGYGAGGVQRFVVVENALIGTVAGATSVLLTAMSVGLLTHFVFRLAIGFDPSLAVLVLTIAAALAVVTAYLSARAPILVRPGEALRNE